MMTKVYYVVNCVVLFILLGVFLGGWHYQSRKVNYSKLENLLKEEKWIEADQETGQVINRILLKVVDDKNFWGYSRIDFLGQERLRVLAGKFACKDFEPIDILWTKYSDEKYGFKAQAKILFSIGANLKRENREYNLYAGRFEKKVGWDYPKLNSQSGFKFHDPSWFNKVNSPNRKEGLLPSPHWMIINSPKSLGVIHFLERYQHCIGSNAIGVIAPKKVFCTLRNYTNY